MEDNIKQILVKMGVDTEDENFKDTPKRVRKAFDEILAYQDGKKRKSELLKIVSTNFPTDYTGIVAQKDIKVISMCPHHMQPIKYSVDIGYIPLKKAIGLSKLARIANVLSARMVLQETFTDDIANTIYEGLDTDGVIVVVRGEHGCMTNRGIKQNIITTTSSIRGIFETDTQVRQEFLAINK